MNLIYSIHSFFQVFFFLIDCHVLRNEKREREREVNIEVDNDRGIHKSVAILSTHVTESFVDFGPLIVENLKINPAF